MLIDSKGNTITASTKFLETAAEVLGILLDMPTVTPEDVPLTAFPFHSACIRRDYELERDFEAGRRPEDEARSVTVRDIHGLCGEHARQLSRGVLATLHYMRCFPESAPPPQSLIWAAGAITHVENDEHLHSVVALFRAHALGVADEDSVNRAFGGVHERGRNVVSPPADEAEADLIFGLIVLLSLDINGERDGKNGPEPYGLAQRYRDDDRRLLATVVEYFGHWADFARLRKADKKPTPAKSWFRHGF